MDHPQISFPLVPQLLKHLLREATGIRTSIFNRCNDAILRLNFMEILNLHIHSFIARVYSPLYRCIYVAHASWALQSHDLSGEGINYGSYAYFFDHTRTWRAFPDEGSAQCRGHLRYNTNMKVDTQHSPTHSFEQGEYERMSITAERYSGTLGA